MKRQSFISPGSLPSSYVSRMTMLTQAAAHGADVHRGGRAFRGQTERLAAARARAGATPVLQPRTARSESIFLPAHVSNKRAIVARKSRQSRQISLAVQSCLASSPMLRRQTCKKAADSLG